jgi:hypothetical protein
MTKARQHGVRLSLLRSLARADGSGQFFGYCDTMEGYYDVYEQAAKAGFLPPKAA